MSRLRKSAIAALAAMLSIASLDAALAVIGEPPNFTYDAARCETCLEYSGPDNRCLKCTHIEGCLINKGGGPRSESPIAREAEARKRRRHL